MTPKLRAGLAAGLAFAALLPSRRAAAAADAKDTTYRPWHRYMAQVHSPKAGCFTATYPSTTWKPTKCAPPPKKRFDVGPTDYYAKLEYGRIESVSGDFIDISGLSSENNSEGGPLTPNAYSLQINPNYFDSSGPGVLIGNGTNPCAVDGANCEGWQQFVYFNNGSGGQIVIEYWLPGFLSTYGSCPIGRAAQTGSTWTPSNGTDCLAGIGGPFTPSFDVSQLGSIEFTAAATGTMDEATLSVGTATYRLSAANVLGLNADWWSAEFNVYGAGGGSTAVFNPGTTVTVVDTVTGPDGSMIPASCPFAGFTGEKNNLNLTCPCFANNAGQVFFTESNAANPVCYCPAGSTWNQSTASCQCDVAGQILNPVTHQCSCPLIGAIVSRGACACPPALGKEGDSCACPAGTIYNVRARRCVPSSSTCPSSCRYGCYAPYVSPQGQPVWNCKPGP